MVNGAGPWREKFGQGLAIHDLGKERLAAAYPALVRALRSQEPDIVISTMYHLNFAVLACKPWLGRKVRFYVREANTPSSAASSAPGRIALHLAYRGLYPLATGIISPSEAIARELGDSYGVPVDRIHILRNPVDVEALRNGAEAPLRKAGESAQFVCVGRLSQQKGYDRLIETISAHDVACHVSIFGEGDRRAALMALIDRRGVGDRVTLAGFDAHTAPWISGADALLLPSRWEGLPNVALESLALGTPVIAAPEAGGIGEIADAAAPGSVTLASPGAELASAMTAIKRRKDNPLSLRPSLLPEAFELQHAVDALANMLLERSA